MIIFNASTHIIPYYNIFQDHPFAVICHNICLYQMSDLILNLFLKSSLSFPLFLHVQFILLHSLLNKTEHSIMHIISFFLVMLKIVFCYKSQKVQRGSDVSLRCDVPLMSKSSTLHWEKDGEQSPNSTLMYNNSAYIILHTVDERSEGNYYCRLMENGRVQTVRIHTVNVTSYSQNKIHTIYRQSGNNSDVSLIFKSKKIYHRLRWTWEQSPKSQIDLIAVEKGIEVQIKGPIEPGRNSSTTYTGQFFIFHISPVNFNYNGTYRCITETSTYTTTILRTIRVSVEPPDGVLRNQSVVLTCEVSEVNDSVTLVWLRMEGNRGVLVKQQTMTEKNNMLRLTVNLASNETDPLHWQCAVFTENTLRALAPITISRTSSNTNAPTESSTVTDQEETMTKDSHLQIKITVACVVTVSVLILLGLLVFKCQRKTGDDSWFKTSHASSEVLDSSTTVIYYQLLKHSEP
uniref:Ig-like domain-containing protein n=1 Tax=Cyprinus carpio carpio TaxID=630221 RepID=A0A9J7XZT8_CYPCA